MSTPYCALTVEHATAVSTDLAQTNQTRRLPRPPIPRPRRADSAGSSSYYAAIPHEWHDGRLSHGAWALRAQLLTYRNPTFHTAYPTRERLAADLGVHPSSVDRYRDELERAGCIKVTRRRPTRRHTRNIYDIVVRSTSNRYERIPTELLRAHIDLDAGIRWTHLHARITAYLLRLAGRDALAWPGQRDIADAANCSVKMVRDVLRDLAQLGWITTAVHRARDADYRNAYDVTGARRHVAQLLGEVSTGGVDSSDLGGVDSSDLEILKELLMKRRAAKIGKPRSPRRPNITPYKRPQHTPARLVARKVKASQLRPDLEPILGPVTDEHLKIITRQIIKRAPYPPSDPHAYVVATVAADPTRYLPPEPFRRGDPLCAHPGCDGWGSDGWLCRGEHEAAAPPDLDTFLSAQGFTADTWRVK
jgi:DNA-binding MarR family transcriptional regulator